MEPDSFFLKFRRSLSARKNYDLFGNDNFEDIHWGKLFVHLFGEFYSRFTIFRKVNNEGLTNNLINYYHLTPNQIIRIDRADDISPYKVDNSSSEVLFIIKEGFLASVSDHRVDLIYGPNISEAERSEVIKLMEKFQISDSPSKVFHMIQQSGGCLELTDFNVKPFEVDIDLHYNDDFTVINNLIVDSLSAKNKNGLVLLHGKYGSGKTYYIRHLISNIDRKFIIFLQACLVLLVHPIFYLLFHVIQMQY